MYEKFGLEKMSRKMKIGLKTILMVKGMVSYWGFVQAIKLKLHRVKTNYATNFPMT